MLPSKGVSPMNLYTRKETAERTGLSSDTLRFYEKLGVIPEPKRGENRYRRYDDDDIVRLLFIKQAKLCGFSLKEIVSTMALVEGTADCDVNSDSIIDDKVSGIDLQIEALQMMRTMLLLYKDRLRGIDSCNLSHYLLDIE